MRLKPDAVRELGLTPTAARGLACAPSSTATSRPTGRRPTASRSRSSCACRSASRENIAQLDDLPVAYAKDGTPIALGRVADIVPVVNPEVIKRQDLQRRQAIYAGMKDRPSGDVGAEVKKIVKATGSCRPATASTSAARPRIRQEAFAARPRGARAAVIFIYIVLASQFGELHCSRWRSWPRCRWR